MNKPSTSSQTDDRLQISRLAPGPRIAYPPGAQAIIDVTQAPYFADNTGQKDCTAILVRVLDEMLQVSRDGMKQVMDLLEAEPAANRVLPGSFENRKQGGKMFGVFPLDGPLQKIIYFPKGTYLVSDTVCYSFDDLVNGLGAELNWCIRFQGEQREGCVIKLKDHCKGFEYGMNRPVVSFIRGPFSNIAMSNYFRDLTIDVGAGNPGAVALEFMGDNCAEVRNVTLRSSDPKLRGQVGLSVSRDGASGCVFRDVEIEGFDLGVSLSSPRCYVLFENLFLRHQSQRGMSIKGGAVVSIRGLFSENKPPALSVRDMAAHVVVLGARLSGGHDDAPGVEFPQGHLYLRDVETRDYRCALGLTYTNGWGTDPLVHAPSITEYVSDPVCTLRPGETPRSLFLPIEDAPIPAWDLNFDHWVHPGMFGAVGDGETDDTAAIQRAMDSGKPVVYFQPGRYRINAPILVPPSVQRVNFMFVDLVAGPQMHDLKDRGMFTVTGESDQPLLMEDLFSFERNYGYHYLFEQASRRTFVARNIHAQSCAAYLNSVPGGRVFLENIISTTGIFNDTYQQPCFIFRGQQAWCRQLDPEYTPDKVLNEGSTLFLMGFKTEGAGVAFTTRNGGSTEVLGGILYFGANDDVPVVLNEASDVAFIASTTGTTSKHVFKVGVREEDASGSRQALHSSFPVRYHSQYVIPLYVGRLR
jgi:hypothetical protein